MLSGDDHIRVAAYRLLRQVGIALGMSVGRQGFEHQIVALDVARAAQPREEYLPERTFAPVGGWTRPKDKGNPVLLRRHLRPCGSRGSGEQQANSEIPTGCQWPFTAPGRRAATGGAPG